MINNYNAIIEKIGNSVFEIDNPARYFGSEFLYGKKEYKETDLKCVLCFPDLYEIGMSNNAVRILYDLFNRQDGVYADRVFSVAPDFEKILREKDIPLFTIQENFSLNTVDYIGITLSSELAATNILQIIDLGKMNIHNSERKESDPVIILGGPACTNPIPFGEFVDFVHIGEGEADTVQIVEILKKYKTRSERIEHLKEIDFLWYKGKSKITKRAVDVNFDQENAKLKHFVVPSFEVAQDHGTVEIMRGCPNGCRFCHAGQFYKPYRQRNLNTVYELVKQNVNEFGYREITLSSLSSGDYPNLDLLMKRLNGEFKHREISFSLPSLKVSSFSLGILEQLSEVRKSGLTFAIETPDLQDQRSMNKEVPLDQIISIIKEAKTHGWRLAKFYFMVGLPFVDKEKEQENIVNFLSQIFKETKINMNINIGTFIPKPLTPFQWSKQFSIEESYEHLSNIKHALMKSIPGIKVSYHEPSISFLEGVISRGNESVGKLIEKAYNLGCRLDAWDEYLKFDKWEEAIKETNYDTSKNSFDINEELPWDCISLNVSKKYLLNEYEKAANRELTSVCDDSCKHNCGVCNKTCNIRKAINENFEIPEDLSIPNNNHYRQVIFDYQKKGKAVFNSHISVMRQFEMAFQRSGLNIKFTEGFNPKPKMEFLNPISLGVSGEHELMLCELPEEEINDKMIDVLNKNFAEGFIINSYELVPQDKTGRKISLSSILKGSDFEVSDIKDPVLDKILDEASNNENENYKVLKDREIYKIHINGDKNIFKSVFGTGDSSLNKFYIAGASKIVRKNIILEKI